MRCNGKIVIDARLSRIDYRWLVVAALDGFPKAGCIYTELFDVDDSYPSIWPTIREAAGGHFINHLIDGKKFEQPAPSSTLIDQSSVSISDQKIVRDLLTVFTLALSEDAMVTTAHESDCASIALLDGKLSVELHEKKLEILEEKYLYFSSVA